jgi:hypothetical protein
MIKYSWARYKDRPIHISDITIEMRSEGKFFHLQTGERMTAYLNGNFQRHFHHIEYSPHDNETYLHETAKEVFYDTYLNCLNKGLPFQIEFWKEAKCNQHFKKTGITCQLNDILDTYDLTQKFKEIKVERKFDEFKPDIQLLSVDGEKVKEVIFIEIFVTHRSTDKKINKGNRIIEIKIRNEDDILMLRSSKLSASNDHLTFYNFKKVIQVIDYCSPNEKGCRTFTNTFILYKSGAYVFVSDTLENTLCLIASEEDRISKIDFKAFDNYYEGLPDKEKREKYVDRLINRGVNIKDCRYCRYQGNNVRNGINLRLFCKFLKKDVEYSTAWDCKYYRLK